jgi:hypothetical protein
VPAKGVEISRPPAGDVPGFLLSLPSTTITYTYNLNVDTGLKLQALIDAFNEVLNIQGGPAPFQPRQRSEYRPEFLCYKVIFDMTTSSLLITYFDQLLR